MDIVAYRVTVRTQKGFSRFYWLIVKLHKNDGLTKRDKKVISHVSPLREFWLTFRRIWGSTGKLYFKNLCFVTLTLIYSLISKYARINDNGGPCCRFGGLGPIIYELLNEGIRLKVINLGRRKVIDMLYI